MDYKDCYFYGCDLGMKLTECDNCTGAVEIGYEKNKRIIKEWFDDLSDFVKYYKINFGENDNLNCFENPEGFICLAVIIGVDDILSQLPIIEEYWNNEIKLTDKVISTILNQVGKVRKFSFS